MVEGLLGLDWIGWVWLELAWLAGCVCRLLGYLVTWLFGYLATWLPGYLVGQLVCVCVGRGCNKANKAVRLKQIEAPSRQQPYNLGHAFHQPSIRMHRALYISPVRMV